MFVDTLANKYSRWYFSIIERSKQRKLLSYQERHHVIPRSLGGSNDKVNIAQLTPREHFICHLLLTKMFASKQAMYKMIRAANAMMYYHGKNRVIAPYLKISARTYDRLKTQYASIMRGPRSDELKRKMSEAKRAKNKERGFRSLSEAQKQAISRGKLASGYKHSEEVCAKITKAMVMRFQSSDERIKTSIATKAKMDCVRGKRWINNKTQNLRLAPDEAEVYVANGWSYGRKSFQKLT